MHSNTSPAGVGSCVDGVADLHGRSRLARKRGIEEAEGTPEAELEGDHAPLRKRQRQDSVPQSGAPAEADLRPKPEGEPDVEVAESAEEAEADEGVAGASADAAWPLDNGDVEVVDEEDEGEEEQQNRDAAEQLPPAQAAPDSDPAGEDDVRAGSLETAQPAGSDRDVDEDAAAITGAKEHAEPQRRGAHIESLEARLAEGDALEEDDDDEGEQAALEQQEQEGNARAEYNDLAGEDGMEDAVQNGPVDGELPLSEGKAARRTEACAGVGDAAAAEDMEECVGGYQIERMH